MTSTSSAELYDPTVPSAGFTIDTTAGPVDMVAVIYRLEGRRGLRLTRAELDVVEAVNKRYSELRPALRRLPGDPKHIRIEVCRRLARQLTDAA